MLHYAVVFFVIALIAALLGFMGIAAGAAGITKILFSLFLIGAVIAFVMSLAHKADPVNDSQEARWNRATRT